MIFEVGELSIKYANDANIPVDIWLKKLDDKNEQAEKYPWNERPEEAQSCTWCLQADNYMPRRSGLGGENSYLIFADTLEELQELVRKHILPLYQTAINILTNMASGNEPCKLYYWSKSDS
jgi:hypothetical protein